jgi:hypothetical protein
VTDSALCVFDVDGDNSNGRQFRNLLSLDPQNLPNYKVTATNPGQYYYNMSVSGTPGETVEVTLQIPWPFVTQGARPVHVYDGVSLYINELGQTCYMPNYDGETQAIDNLIELSDFGVAPGDSGYPGGEPTTVEVTLPVTIPENGFAYVNQHMDYGLKDRDTDFDGDGIADPQGYVKDANDDALKPDQPVDAPIVLIPELVNHEFCTFLGMEELGCDSVQNDNEFKTNPGTAGMVLEWLQNSEGEVYEEALEGATVQLIDEDGTIVGEDLSDQDGWYQIVYKHKGKPSNYTFRATLADGTTFERVVELKGNEFEEVNVYLDSTGGVALNYVHVEDMQTDVKSGPKTWNATVGILVVDDGGAGIANAQVSGIWGGWGAGELGFCVTDAEGWCEVDLVKIPNGETVNFTIVDIAADGYFYDPDANVVTYVTLP